jgi:phage gp45-like
VPRGAVIVEDTKTVQYGQARLNSLETIGDIPRYQEYGFTSNSPIGIEGILICGSGDRTNGIIIATETAKYRMKALKSGEMAIYDNQGQSVYLSAAGITVNGGGNPIKYVNAPYVLFDMPIRSNYDITDNYGTNTRSMAGMRLVANLHTHNFIAQGGSSNLTTNPPNQPE